MRWRFASISSSSELRLPIMFPVFVALVVLCNFFLKKRRVVGQVYIAAGGKENVKRVGNLPCEAILKLRIEEKFRKNF